MHKEMNSQGAVPPLYLAVCQHLDTGPEASDFAFRFQPGPTSLASTVQRLENVSR